MNVLYYVILLLPLSVFFHYDAISQSNKNYFNYTFAPSLNTNRTYFCDNGNNFCDIKNNNQLRLEEFSLAAWFKNSQKNFSEPGHIINKGGFDSDAKGKNMNYGIWMNIDGTISSGFESEIGENFGIVSPKKYNDGKWHYVIVTYNSTVLRMDIDGQNIKNEVINKKPSISGNQPVRIGANSLILNKFFNGEIDEVRIWNRALTFNEIKEIYYNQNFNATGQIEYINFDNNTDTNNNNILNNITNNIIQIHNKPITKIPIFVIISSTNVTESSNGIPTKKSSLSNYTLFLENATNWVKNSTKWVKNTKASVTKISN